MQSSHTPDGSAFAAMQGTSFSSRSLRNPIKDNPSCSDFGEEEESSLPLGHGFLVGALPNPNRPKPWMEASDTTTYSKEMVSCFCMLTDAAVHAAFQHAVTFLQPADSPHVVGYWELIVNFRCSLASFWYSSHPIWRLTTLNWVLKSGL